MELSIKLHRGSYTSDHVLLNLLNELGKSDQMLGLRGISLRLCNDFNEFDNTGAQILDSIFHMTFQLFKNCIFGRDNFKILSYFMQRYNERQYVTL